MTEAEKQEIVGLLMTQISSQAVDFDLQTVTPQRTDILPAVRPDGAGGYTGVTLDWGGITDELTTQAKGFRDEALQAKRDTELLKSETNGIKSEVNDIYTQFNQVVDSTIESVRNVYQSDLSAEATARQEADNALGGRIDAEELTRAEADTAIGSRIDTETTTRESQIAELDKVNTQQKYDIENLKAKAEGQIFRTEVVDTEAYSFDVPSSVAPYAELQKIGGKSVVWNQLVSPKSLTVNGVSLTELDGIWTINGTGTDDGGRNASITSINPTFKNGNVYAILIEQTVGVNIYFSKQETAGYVTNFNVSKIYKPTVTYTAIVGINFSKGVEYSGTLKLMIFDLTQMFGSGNEPTLEECQKIFTADYYPYDIGTIKSFPVQRVKSFKADGTEMGNIDISSLTADLKSVGQYHDEWSNGKVTKRIGVVDLGTLNWDSRDSISSGFFTSVAFLKAKGLCFTNKYQTQTVSGNWNSWNDCSISHNDGYRGGVTGNALSNCFIIKDTSKSGMTGAEFKASLNGMLCYYELAEPTEETVPEIDNYLQVEGGGTLTFESDETVKMPVPSTTRFVVDLT